MKLRSILAAIILVGLAASLAAAADDAGTLQRAQELFAAGQYAQAETTARQALSASDAAVLTGACDVVILCRLGQGDFDGAKQAATDLKAQITDESTQAYLDEQIGGIEAKKAAYEQAIADLEAILSAHADDELGASAAYKIAATELFWGRQSDALAAFQRVVDEFSFSDRALLARLAMGGMHERAGRYGDAEAVYQQVVVRAPDSPYAAQAVAGIKAARLAQDDVLGAKEQMDDIINAHADTEASAMAQYCQGEILLYEGKPDGAQAAFDEVARAHRQSVAGGAAAIRTAAALLGEARSLSDDAEYEAAIAKLREVLDLAPGSTYAQTAQLFVAHNCLWLRNWEDGAREYRKVVEDYPDTAAATEAAYYVGISYAHFDTVAAVEWLESTVETDPEERRVARALFVLAEARYDNGDAHGAYAALDDLLSRKGEAFDLWHPWTLYQKADLQRRDQRWDDALATLEQLGSDYPATPAAEQALELMSRIHRARDKAEQDSERGE